MSTKTGIIATYDLFVILTTFIISFNIRFSQLNPDIFSSENFSFVVFVGVLPQFITIFLSRIHQGVWRFTGTNDLIRIIKASTFAIASSIITLFIVTRLESIPRTIFIINWMLLILGLGGGRFLYRMWHDSKQAKDSKLSENRVLIIGAGVGGAQIAKQMQQTSSLNIKIIGFIDDDKKKRGRSIHGVNVLGNVQDIPNIIENTNITQALIAIPSATGVQIRKIIETCKNFDIEIKTLPRIRDILDGKVELSQLRKVTPEDLLGRESINIDSTVVSNMIKDKTVLITGAGGSIGREICRQILTHSPKHIIAYELTELFIYELEKYLESKKEEDSPTVITYIVGDVRNKKQLENAIKSYRPDVIFHTAAYKHVPIMEENPLEAIKTNVRGTQLTVDLAEKYQVERFVLISTDKAINPTNIMGTSKRIAEMLCIEKQKESKTKYMIVRFGNVLGSSGSVIPLFKKQIEAGGPVTVTHQDITRYFMSIPEATQLVIQAGALGTGGEIFVLKMGSPVKILKLAEHMITLSGLKPYEDIEINFTGLRPGEKLYEELFSNVENMQETLHPKIYIAKAVHQTDSFQSKINFLLTLPEGTEKSIIQSCLREIVTEYSPDQNATKSELH